jgi:hypothetical protein
MKERTVRYVLILSLLIAAPCWSQTSSTGQAETKGPCSPAVTGSKNTFMINCGISQKQGQQMLNILNKVLANQLDPEAVMAKLDEIQNDIRHIQSRQGWPELTEEQIRTLRNTLIAFPGNKVMIIVENPDTNKSALALQLRDVIQSPKWSVTLGANMLLASPTTGIYITVKEETPAAVNLLNVFIEIFGKSAVQARVDNKMTDEDIAISIYDSPKPSSLH